jgi:hypothetical protein
MVTLPLPQSQYPDGPRQSAFYGRLLDGVRLRPGISNAALVFPPPFQGTNASGSFSIEGRGKTTNADQPTAALASISPGYFQALGIPVVKGRDITDRTASRRRGRHGEPGARAQVLPGGRSGRQAHPLR